MNYYFYDATGNWRGPYDQQQIHNMYENSMLAVNTRLYTPGFEQGTWETLGINNVIAKTTSSFLQPKANKPKISCLTWVIVAILFPVILLFLALLVGLAVPGVQSALKSAERAKKSAAKDPITRELEKWTKIKKLTLLDGTTHMNITVFRADDSLHILNQKSDEETIDFEKLATGVEYRKDKFNDHSSLRTNEMNLAYYADYKIDFRVYIFSDQPKLFKPDQYYLHLSSVSDGWRFLTDSDVDIRCDDMLIQKKHTLDRKNTKVLDGGSVYEPLGFHVTNEEMKTIVNCKKLLFRIGREEFPLENMQQELRQFYELIQIFPQP
jgi:hypothetical protein